MLFTFFPSDTFLSFQTFVLSSFLFLLPTLQDFVDFKVEVIVMADTSLLSIFHIFNFVVLVVGMAETEFKLKLLNFTFHFFCPLFQLRTASRLKNIGVEKFGGKAQNSLKQYFPPMLQAETFNNYTDCFALRLV